MSQRRVELEVPYAEKDEAKRLGAKWDATARVWFVPEGIESTAFSRWIPDSLGPCIRANSYFVAIAKKPCWKCGKETSVIAPFVCGAYEVLLPVYDEESDDEDLDWVGRTEPTTLYYVDWVEEALAKRLAYFSPKFRRDFSKTTASHYWMNHCDHCDAKQGDYELHCEPGGAFQPLEAEDAAGVVLVEVGESLECSGEYADYSTYAQLLERYSPRDRVR